MIFYSIFGSLLVILLFGVAGAFFLRRDWLVKNYARIVLGLLAFQYAFVVLVFSTYTQNIILLKDLCAPFVSAIILFTWVAGEVAETGRWKLPRHGVVPPMVAVLLYWVVTVYRAPASARAVEEWGQMAGHFISVFAMIRFLREERHFRFLARVVVITASLTIFYGLGQLHGFDFLVMLGPEMGIPDWGRNVYVSTFGCVCSFGAYLAVIVPFLIGLFFFVRRPLHLAVLPILGFLGFYEIWEAEKPADFIALWLTLPVVLLLYIINFRNVWKRIAAEKARRIAFGFTVVAIVVAAIAWREPLGKSFETVSHLHGIFTKTDSHFTNRARLVFWQMATDLGLREPLFGNGMGSFNFMMPYTRPSFYHRAGTSHNSDRAYNEFLEWLADTGLIGLGLFLLVLFAFFISCLREFRRHRSSRYYPLLVATAAGPWVIWIMGLFDVHSRWPMVGVFHWFSVGFALAFANLSTQPESLPHVEEVPSLPRLYPFWKPIIALFLLLILFMAAKFHDFWMSDHHLRNNMAWSEGNQNDNARALEESVASFLNHPHNVSNYYKLAYAHLATGQLEKAMQAYRTLQGYAPNYAQIHVNLSYLDDQMGFRTASAWERDRATIIEYNTRNCRDAAMYWAMLGYPDRSIGHLRRALMIERDRNDGTYSYWMDHDAVTMELAQVYLNNNMPRRATAELRRAIQMNPANVQAALAFVDLLRQQGEHDEADRIAEKLGQVRARGGTSP